VLCFETFATAVKHVQDARPQRMETENQTADNKAPAPSSNQANDDLPEKLSGTLRHIVGQLDIITTTVRMMEERLTANETRLAQVQQVQSKVIEQLDLRL